MLRNLFVSVLGCVSPTGRHAFLPLRCILKLSVAERRLEAGFGRWRYSSRGKGSHALTRLETGAPNRTDNFEIPVREPVSGNGLIRRIRLSGSSEGPPYDCFT